MRGGPESLSTLLSQLTPLLARDFAPGFRAAFWADTKVMHLLRRHNAALRSAWAARSWYPHGASLAAIEADMLNCGLVCDNYAVDLHGSASYFLSLSIEHVKEAFVDSLDLDGAASPNPRLNFEGWVECMGRCALGLYGPLELLKLQHLTDCILRNVLHGQTIASAVDAVWHEVRGQIRIWNAETAAEEKAEASVAGESSPGTGSPGKEKRGKRGAVKLSKSARRAAAKSSAAAKGALRAITANMGGDMLALEEQWLKAKEGEQGLAALAQSADAPMEVDTPPPCASGLPPRPPPHSPPRVGAFLRPPVPLRRPCCPILTPGRAGAPSSPPRPRPLAPYCRLRTLSLARLTRRERPASGPVRSRRRRAQRSRCRRRGEAGSGGSSSQTPCTRPSASRCADPWPQRYLEPPPLPLTRTPAPTRTPTLAQSLRVRGRSRPGGAAGPDRAEARGGGGGPPRPGSWWNNSPPPCCTPPPPQPARWPKGSGRSYAAQSAA